MSQSNCDERDGERGEDEIEMESRRKGRSEINLKEQGLKQQ